MGLAGPGLVGCGVIGAGVWSPESQAYEKLLPILEMLWCDTQDGKVLNFGVSGVCGVASKSSQEGVDGVGEGGPGVSTSTCA